MKVKTNTKDDIFQCPVCRSEHTARHGFNVTKEGKFRRRKCQECGKTFYENKEVTK